MHTIYKTTIAGFDITLMQRGFDDFIVGYGLQLTAGLSYIEAAHELGECILHALVCDSKIRSK